MTAGQRGDENQAELLVGLVAAGGRAAGCEAAGFSAVMQHV